MLFLFFLACPLSVCVKVVQIFFILAIGSVKGVKGFAVGY